MMKGNKHMKTITNIIYLAIVVFAFGCFTLLPGAQAVSPPPDGGYPGGNTAEGQNALLGLTTGTYNTAVGFLSLLSNTEGNFNTAIGAGALLANVGNPGNSEGIENTATGAGALLSNTTGGDNTADGAFALSRNTTGSLNTAFGALALRSLTGNSFRNTAIGSFALSANIAGGGNTAVGDNALTNSTGSNNTAIGETAGLNLTTGDNDIDIGYNVLGVAGESNTIRIGDTDITDTFIRGISGTTIASGDAVLVASNGHLGTSTSSRRFKQDIKPMDNASEAIFSLKPVTFHYKKEIDPAGSSQFGLVAEDVERVNPDLVTRDENGKVNSVRYDKVNAMLLNEFLKEHKAFVVGQHKVETLEAAVATLVATLKEQAAQIQKVSAQLQLKKPTPQTVSNNE